MPRPENIFSLIMKEASPFLGRPAIAEPGGRAITYEELFSLTEKLAESLSSHGIGKYARVGLVLENSPEYVALSLAVLSLEAAIVPVSPDHTASEVEGVMKSICVGHVLYAEGGPYNIGGRGGAVVCEDGMRVLLSSTGIDTGDFPEGYEEITPAFIRFSSGTTGASKGVVLSHRAIAERTDAADAGLNITHGDSVLWVLSMSFHFVVTILLFLRRGACIVLCREPFPEGFLRGIKEHGGNVIYAAPYHYDMLASSDEVSGDELKKVRLAISTTVKLPDSIALQFAKKFGFPLTEAYGIIEVGLPFVGVRKRGPEGAGSLGRPLPAYEIRIDSPDETGAGEILLRGPGMLDAYFEPWRRSGEALDRGWFRTGDLGRLSDDGELYIVGRKKNVINFSGMKIFPFEVEEVINSFPGVRESMVYPEEHSAYGQLPMAKVVAEEGAEPDMRALRRFCYERLARYKAPKGFELVDSLPRTMSGKIARH
jgi:long-chain acyl-CoA synthetase